MKCVTSTNLRNIWGQWRSVRSSWLAIVWPEFRQSYPWKCSVSRPKWCKVHVAVTEKFAMTNILNVVAHLQLEICKSIQHLFKYPTNKNHHNFLQNHTKAISTWSLSNRKSSKIFLNIRSVIVTNRGIQIGKGAAGGLGLKGLMPRPLSDQNIDVYFLSFPPTLYCKSRSGALQNVLWQSHRRSNTFVIKPSCYEFSRFEKYWSSFLHSCLFCTTIYNKSWVLPCSVSVETSMTFELPTMSIDV